MPNPGIILYFYFRNFLLLCHSSCHVSPHLFEVSSCDTQNLCLVLILLLARETPLLLGIVGPRCLFDWYTFFQIPSPWVLQGMVWGNQKVLGGRQVLEITLKLLILGLDFFFEVFLRRVLRHLSLLCALRGSNCVVQSGVDFLLDTLLKKPSCAQNSKI